jgi:hypothetical protein
LVGTIKVELLYWRIWRTRQEAGLAVFRWIEGWYNSRRIRDGLGWRSPAEYEAAYAARKNLSILATAKSAPACGPEHITDSNKTGEGRLLDAGSIARHLLNADGVFAILTVHRVEMFAMRCSPAVAEWSGPAQRSRGCGGAVDHVRGGSR